MKQKYFSGFFFHRDTCIEIHIVQRKYTKEYIDIFLQEFFGTKGAENITKIFLKYSSQYCNW